MSATTNINDGKRGSCLFNMSRRVVSCTAFILSAFLSAVGGGCRESLKNSGVASSLMTNSFSKSSADSVVDLGCRLKTDSRFFEMRRQIAAVGSTLQQENIVTDVERAAIEAMEQSSAEITGKGRLALGVFNEFYFRYSWRKNAGTINVYHAQAGSNRLELVIYCYEHIAR